MTEISKCSNDLTIQQLKLNFITINTNFQYKMSDFLELEQYIPAFSPQITCFCGFISCFTVKKPLASHVSPPSTTSIKNMWILEHACQNHHQRLQLSVCVCVRMLVVENTRFSHHPVTPNLQFREANEKIMHCKRENRP